MVGQTTAFGIRVAKLAGVPDKVVARAKQVLSSIEDGTELKTRGTKGMTD